MTCVFEFRSHQRLEKALLSSRNRFRCFDVSEECIGAGSSSGDVFLFERSSQQLIRRIPAASAKIDQIAFNPVNDNIFCIATNRGEVSVLELRDNFNSAKDVQVLLSIQAHLKNNVSQIAWGSLGSQLIVGDDNGVVSVTDLYALDDSLLFELSPTNALELDSSIVQIDSTSSRVLISTLTATYLCDLSDRCFTKVGKKARNGEYGACFFENSGNSESDSGDEPEIYCARPGGRLWKVNAFGEVECTLNLKHEGSTPLDHSVISLDGTWRTEQEFTQKVNFGKMMCLGELLVSFTDSALFIIDVFSSEVPRIAWQTSELRDSLMQAFVCDDSLFLALRNGSLLEWRIASRSESKIMYMLSTPAQRLAVICKDWTTKHLECLDIIRRRETFGKELVCRNSNWQMMPAKTRTVFDLSISRLLPLLRYYEGIICSADPRYYLRNIIVFNLPREAVSEQQPSPAPERSSPGDAEKPAASSPKKIVKTREAHKRLLCDIINRRQKEIADSMLVELNASLWAPHVLQGKHYIDKPLIAWGMRTNFEGSCDSCGENLVMEAFEEDLQVHYCGHRFHASCNPSDRLCCVCLQR